MALQTLLGDSMSSQSIENNIEKMAEICQKNPIVLLKKLDLNVRAKYKNLERNNMMIVGNCVFIKKYHNISYIYECSTTPDCNVRITFNKEVTKIVSLANEHNHNELPNNEIEKILKEAATREFKRSYLWKKDMNIRIKYKSSDGNDMIVWNNYEYFKYFINRSNITFRCVKYRSQKCSAKLAVNHNLTEVLSDPLPILKHNHEELKDFVLEKIKNHIIYDNDPKKIMDIKAIYTGVKGKLLIIANNFQYVEYGSGRGFLGYIAFQCVDFSKTRCRAKLRTNSQLTQILSVHFEHNHEGLTESEVNVHQMFAAMDMNIEKVYKNKRGSDMIIVNNYKLVKRKFCKMSRTYTFYCNNNCPAKVHTNIEMTKVLKIFNFIHNHEGITQAEKDLIVKNHEEYMKLVTDPELDKVQNFIALLKQEEKPNSFSSKRSLGKKCAYLTCGKYNIQVPGEKFYPFPMHRHTRNEWALRAGLEQHERIQNGFLVVDKLFLCQDHFDSDCILNGKLKKDAMPLHIDKKALHKFDYSLTNLCKSCGSLNSINECNCIHLESNSSNFSDVCKESTSSNHCIVRKCKSKYSIKKVPTFPLPTDLSLQKAWINNVPLPVDYKPSKINFYVCLNHFKKYDIFRSHRTLSIKSEAVPKKFNLPIEQDREIKKCCLPYCTSNHFNDQEPVITFPFPTDFHIQRQEWIKAIFKQHLVHITEGSICIIHFNPDLIYTRGNNKCYLKHGAIPSNLFLNELKHKVCCVPGCETFIDSKVDLFRFPNRNETLVEVIKIKSEEANTVKDTRMLWEERVGINHATNSTLICKNHFDNTCFFMDGNKLCLEKLAVPTLNLPKPIDECLIIPKCTESDVIISTNEEETLHLINAQNENHESLHKIKETEINSHRCIISKPIENRDNYDSVSVVNELSIEKDIENSSHVLNEHDYQMIGEIQPVVNTLSSNQNHICGCTRECYIKFTHEYRKAIWYHFSKLNGVKERQFIANYCEPIQNYSKRPKSCKFTKFSYHLPLNGNHVRVCRQFFESTLKITSRRVKNLLTYNTNLSMSKKKSRALIEEEIRLFLLAKPRLPSKETYKEGLTVVSLYRDYVKECKNENKMYGHEGIFREIYKSEFKVPKENVIRPHRVPRKAHFQSSFQKDQVFSTKELKNLENEFNDDDTQMSTSSDNKNLENEFNDDTQMSTSSDNKNLENIFNYHDTQMSTISDNKNLKNEFNDYDTQMSTSDEIQPVLNALSSNSNCETDSCPHQCYTISQEDRETIYSHFSQLDDTAKKSNFFLRNCEPILPRTIKEQFKYYLPLNKNRVRVCSKFFWTTLKMKAININSIYDNNRIISPKTSCIHNFKTSSIRNFNEVKKEIRLFLESKLPISKKYQIASLYKDYVKECQNQNKVFGNFPIFKHIHKKEFKVEEKIICAPGSRGAREKKKIQDNIMNGIRLFLKSTPRLPTSETKKEGLTLPSLHRDYVKKCEKEKKKYGTLGLFNQIYKSEFHGEKKIKRRAKKSKETSNHPYISSESISDVSFKEDLENFTDDDDYQMNNFESEIPIVFNKFPGNSRCEVYNPFTGSNDTAIKTETDITPMNDSTQLLNPEHSLLKNLLLTKSKTQYCLAKISETAADNQFFTQTNEDDHNTMENIKQEVQDIEIVENPIFENNFQQN